MIGKLTGTIDSVADAHVLVDVGGVGYVVTCSARTLRALGRAGEPVSLRIETHVREDAISLYGFAEADEQNWFRLLTTVQGVGAKVALAILSVAAPEQLTNTIAAADKAALTQADGVGPKLALRIVTELKDKVAALAGLGAAPRGAAMADAGMVAPSSAAADAVSALVNLGYRRGEAFGAVAAAHRRRPDARLDELIRLGLADLSRGETAA